MNVWGGILLYIAAAFAFAIGWLMRATLRQKPMTLPDHVRQILHDWAEAHRLLDRLQVGVHETELTPRVRWLADQMAAQVGWPTGAPPESFAAKHEEDPVSQRNIEKRSRS